jgi:glycosyltransferase involved in cell wall biosynthesis
VARYVSVVIVNYKTQALTRQAVSSFISRYHDVPLLVIDNGSQDKSVGTIQKLAMRNPSVTAHLLTENVYHGPALDQAFHLLETPYILTLDSDTITKKGGWLEAMLGHFRSDPRLYAIGWLRWVNHNGVATRDGLPRPNLHPYIHPYCALFDRAKYHTLQPFFRDGAPCRVNMFNATKAGYHLVSFPIDQYVTHLIAGTRRMWKGRWDPKSDERPGGWREDAKYPI